MPVVSVDAKLIPLMHTEDVSTLISDSGITRYHLEAKIWDSFSNAEEPYWYFPKGISVERFDSLLNIEGSIKADTAYYFEKKELWQLIGHVFVKNMEGRTFETSELFWNQAADPNSLDAFYTQEFVTITEPNGNVTFGRTGFRSNQSLSTVRLFSVGADLNVEEQTDMQKDSIQNP